MASTFCSLMAKDTLKNIDRKYSLLLQRDLFGGWILITRWGRDGSKGQGKQYSFTDEAKAQKKFQQVLKRRLNAQKRIGCNYQVVEKA